MRLQVLSEREEVLPKKKQSHCQKGGSEAGRGLSPSGRINPLRGRYNCEAYDAIAGGFTIQLSQNSDNEEVRKPS